MTQGIFNTNITELADCCEAIRVWMRNNKFKLDPDKTEFILMIDGNDGNRNSLKSSFHLSLLGNIMGPAESVRNLGVTLDAQYLMQKHVANLCCVCYYRLWEVRRVHRYLTHKKKVNVANTIVSSQLDYCNSVLYHGKNANIRRYQGIKNALCHIVCRLNNFSHVTPFLHKLQWLPIQYCILFRYHLLTHKATNFSQYLSCLSSLIKPNDLRLGNRLSVFSTRPNRRTSMRSFAVAALTVRNKLPQAIRTQDSIAEY